ncbi:MAG TPA: hypothetical protein VIL46_03265, partial [Gemmataceae bacterium]
LGLGLAWAAWAGAASAPPAAGRAEDLVRQLGNASFQVREAAAAELLRLGMAAREELLRGKEDPDPEVRRRCARLLERIEDADMEARIDAFLADPRPEKAEGLPGVKRFRARAGGDKGAMALYVEMLRAHTRLLKQFERDPDSAGDRYAALLGELYERYRAAGRRADAVTRADVAAFLFLGADERARDANVPIQHVYSGLSYPPLSASLRETDAESRAMRRLLVGWAERQTNPSVINRVFTLASASNVKEILPLAVRFVKDDSALGTTRAYALLAVARYGAKEHLAAVEKLLDSPILLSQVNVNGRRGTTELGDVALAVAAHLKGKDIHDYGFDMLRGNVLSFTSFSYLGFSDDAKRKAARKKWADEAKR